MSRNRAKCLNCGDIVESKSRHDWVTCSCFHNEANTRGFFLDGGGEYGRYGGCIEDIEWIEGDDDDDKGD